MPELQPETTELTAQYTSQVAADLERNAKEQQRISEQLAALEGQLDALQRNHTVLVTVREALSGEARNATEAPARKRNTGKAKADAKQAPLATESADAKASPGKPEKAAAPQPTLGELIHAYLGRQTEPRSIAEITTGLAQDHPDRGVKGTVVRNTVENLVARAQVERHKQGGSVFYTSVSQEEQAAEGALPAPEVSDSQPSAELPG